MVKHAGVRVFTEIGSSTQLPPCMPPCFDNALALVLYLTLIRSLQMVANHSASNGMKEPCINNNKGGKFTSIMISFFVIF